MYMAMFVLNEPDKLDELLETWLKSGISGVTIIESSGMHRVANRTFPMRYLPATENLEQNSLTLLLMLDDREEVDKCLLQLESVVGDLSLPDTGVFAVWPLEIWKKTA